MYKNWQKKYIKTMELLELNELINSENSAIEKHLFSLYQAVKPDIRKEELEILDNLFIKGLLYLTEVREKLINLLLLSQK